MSASGCPVMKARSSGNEHHEYAADLSAPHAAAGAKQRSRPSRRHRSRGRNPASDGLRCSRDGEDYTLPVSPDVRSPGHRVFAARECEGRSAPWCYGFLFSGNNRTI